MRCPQHAEFWYTDIDREHPEVARHLATCARCRAEAERAAQLQELLAYLPAATPPARIAATLQAPTGDALNCAETQELLEAWRAGAVDGPRAFLIEDHLLWCDACAAELATADTLATLLPALPELTPPAIIADRIARARQPWWQRLLPPVPRFNWGLAYAGAMTVLVALVATLNWPAGHVMPVANNSKSRIVRPADLLGPALKLAIPSAPQSAPTTIANNAIPRKFGMLPTVPDMPEAVVPPAAKTVPRSLVIRAASGWRMKVAPVPETDEPEPPMPASAPETEKPVTEPVYIASAREAVLSLHREATLTNIEDSLTNIAETPARPAGTAAPAPRENADRIAPAPETMVAEKPVRVEEVNRALDQELRRANARGTGFAAISVHSERAPAKGTLKIATIPFN